MNEKTQFSSFLSFLKKQIFQIFIIFLILIFRIANGVKLGLASVLMQDFAHSIVRFFCSFQDMAVCWTSAPKWLFLAQVDISSGSSSCSEPETEEDDEEVRRTEDAKDRGGERPPLRNHYQSASNFTSSLTQFEVSR